MPLFRAANGKDVKYGESNNLLKSELEDANLRKFASNTHSLRIGGATAYANPPNGGALGGIHGLWFSNANYDYLHAAQAKFESAGNVIAREKGESIVTRAGPVRSYGGTA